ncbi:MAG: FAD:protein FMN transferase [Planctomycetaceae bacterium]|jgi:thiamine biosynthesis lipoprotein|nr:FAD:protein FMN transferase [Planctomycetaceae bacterium]
MSDTLQTKNQFSFGMIIYYAIAIAVTLAVLWYIFVRKPVEYVDHQVDGASMGTVYSLRVHDFVLGKDWEQFASDIQGELNQLEGLMSSFLADSEVSRFNASDSTEWFPVSAATAKVVKLALEISTMTDGAFDITSATLVEFWGFGAEKTDSFKHLTDEEIAVKITEIKETIGYDKLEVRLDPPAIKKLLPEIKIDLSGIAKGYAVDVIAEFCERSNLRHYIIEVGGEVRCNGNKGDEGDWRVGIERPDIIPRGEWGGIHQLIVIGKNSMATSGVNRNYHVVDGKYYSHIIDPRDGMVLQRGTESELIEREQIGSVSVIDKSCAKADGLATAMMVLGETEGLRIANEQNLPVLFLMRKNTNIREAPSTTFYKTAQKFEKTKQEKK